VGARFQARLDRRVFSATLRAPSLARAQREAQSGLRDLEAVQKAFTSPAFMSLFDLPFAPIFFAGIFLFHPWLGYLALGGAVVLIALALANQVATKRPLEAAAQTTMASEIIGQQVRHENEIIQSLGMRDAAFNRWQQARGRSLEASIAAQDAGGTYSALIKGVRLFLQSAMLGLGAYLVLQGSVSGGVMIASSILLGRALAPIETIVGQWAVLERGREGWRNVTRLLGEIPEEQKRTVLPRPKGRLELEQVTVVPPGESQATLRMISFRVEPGQAVGVIGTSGSGKSTLARAITGTWRPAAGKIRLDGAALDQYDPDVLGKHVGYLPQRVALFDGTIKDNIARLSPEPDDAAVVRAAQAAAAHDMILKLPDGYDTRVCRPTRGRLSGGTDSMRIGLARALYGDPVFVVLDEPNSNPLDNDGSHALNEAILRARSSQGRRGAHHGAPPPGDPRNANLLLMISKWARAAPRPQEEVLREMVANHRQIAATAAEG
jgi:ATP-binding cassette subfamily C protein